MDLKSYYSDFGMGGDTPAVAKVADLLVEILPEALVLQDQELTGSVSGTYTSFNIEGKIQFFTCDITFDKDNQVNGKVPAGLWVGALFRGDHETLFGNQSIRFAGNGIPTILSFGETTDHVERYTAHNPLRMSSYLVAKDFFERTRNEVGDTPLAALDALITPGVNQHPLPASKKIAQTLLHLADNPYRGRLARLFVESTVISSIFELAQLFYEQSEPKFICGFQQRELAIEAVRLINDGPEQFDSIMSLATQLGTNETTLQRVFKLETGGTIFQYVLRCRMQAARILIRDKRLPISQVAYQVGYSSPANFSTAYKRFFGHTPATDRA